MEASLLWPGSHKAECGRSRGGGGEGLGSTVGQPRVTGLAVSQVPARARPAPRTQPPAQAGGRPQGLGAGEGHRAAQRAEVPWE